MKITVETTVKAPIAEVWRAYTTPADIKQWNAASADWHTTAASVDLREGGAFSSRMEAKDGSVGFDFAGTYTRIVEHELIEYAFGDRAAKVVFADRPEGVNVLVTFDSEQTHSIEQQREGWQAILENFARHVEAKGVARADRSATLLRRTAGGTFASPRAAAQHARDERRHHLARPCRGSPRGTASRPRTAPG